MRSLRYHDHLTADLYKMMMILAQLVKVKEMRLGDHNNITRHLHTTIGYATMRFTEYYHPGHNNTTD